MKRQQMQWLLPFACLIFVLAFHWSQEPANAYITAGRWSGTSTEYVTQSSLGSSPFPSGTTGLVNTAAARWSKPSTGINFTIVNFNGQIGPVRMQVGSGNFATLGYPDVPGANAIGTSSSGNLTSSYLRLNTTWTWNTSCTLNQSQKKADVLTILLHEMGHSVRLQHDAAQTGAVMWPNYVCKQTLRTDDKNGIDALY